MISKSEKEKRVKSCEFAKIIARLGHPNLEISVKMNELCEKFIDGEIESDDVTNSIVVYYEERYSK